MIKKATDFLGEQEGIRLHSYQDIRGIWTIGWGSTMYTTGVAVGPNETVTLEKANALRDWEIANKSKVIINLLNGKEINDNQMVALISFTYQEGVGNLANSTLLKVIKVDPNDTAIVKVDDVSDVSVKTWMIKNKWLSVNKITMCFMMFNKVKDRAGVKQFNEAVLNRRIREANMYFSKS